MLTFLVWPSILFGKHIATRRYFLAIGSGPPLILDSRNCCFCTIEIFSENQQLVDAQAVRFTHALVRLGCGAPFTEPSMGPNGDALRFRFILMRVPLESSTGCSMLLYVVARRLASDFVQRHCWSRITAVEFRTRISIKCTANVSWKAASSGIFRIGVDFILDVGLRCRWRLCWLVDPYLSTAGSAGTRCLCRSCFSGVL